MKHLLIAVVLIFAVAATSHAADPVADATMLREDRMSMRFAKIAYYPVNPSYLKFNDTDLTACELEWDMIDYFDFTEGSKDCQVKFFLNS